MTLPVAQNLFTNPDRKWWEVLRTWRFWALIGAAEMCLTRGTAYNFVQDVKDRPPPGLASLSTWWVQVYGAAWGIAAILCVLLAFTERQWYLAIAYVAAPALVWAIAYGITWITMRDTSWTGAGFFHGLALLIFWVAMARPPGGWRE